MKQVTSLNEDDDENEDRQNSSASSSTTSSTGTTTSSLSSSTRRQKLKNGLDVLPEEEDDLNNEDGGIAIPVPQRKMSENKLLQTDITYGKANKRIQVWQNWQIYIFYSYVKGLKLKLTGRPYLKEKYFMGRR
jgi:hypothetical protein